MDYADEKDADLRASDAERDAVVTKLSEHFQDGRLDQAEFDQRMSTAMTAKTRGALAVLLTDMPGRQPDPAPPSPAAPAPVRACGRRPGLLGVLPVIIAAVLIASLVSGGGQHHWYLGLIIALLAMRPWLLGRRWRAGRGRL